MNILNTETGEFGLHVGDVRSWFAQQEIAAAVADEFDGELGPFAAYAKAATPAFDPATHKAVQIAPAEIEGVLTQQWQIIELTQQELDQIEADRLAAEQAAKDAARITVTKRQALLALFDLKGIKDSDIDAQIDSIPDETTRYRARVDWQGAALIESDSPTVLMLAASLNLSEQDLALLFEYAKTL
jgi:Spy/CpxP family protein refolding chaperone